MSRKPSTVRRSPQSAQKTDAATAPARRLTDADVDLPPSRPFVQNLGIVVGAFAAATLIAQLLGAANLGTAMSFGQIGFAIALVYVLLRR